METCGHQPVDYLGMTDDKITNDQDHQSEYASRCLVQIHAKPMYLNLFIASDDGNDTL